MPDITELKALLERVREAEWPDREIDHAIFIAFLKPEKWFGVAVESHFRNGDGYGYNTIDGWRHLDCDRPPFVTASIDAAVALVESCLPEANCYGAERSPSGWDCYVSRNHVERRKDAWLYSADNAKSGALGLMGALLQALIAKAERAARALSDLAELDGETTA